MSQDKSSNPLSWNSVLSLYVPGMLLMLGSSMVAPVIPVYAKSFDVNLSTASWVFVAWAAGSVAATFPAGYLMDKIGRRPVVLSGPIIASDVTGEVDLHADDDQYGERPAWWLLWERMKGTPSIVSILMRSGTVGSEAQRRLVREQANYLFEPPLKDLGLRDWKSFDRAVAEGYAHARMVIEQKGVPLTDVWTDGPAVAVLRHKIAV